MKFHLQTKNIKLHPAQEYIIEKGYRKIERLCANFPDELKALQVIVAYHNPPKNFGVHLKLDLPGTHMATHASDFKFNLAFKEALNKMLARIRKYKETLRREFEYEKVAQMKGKLPATELTNTSQ